MNIFLILTIAVSLSMDAFSLSLAYGTLNISKKDIHSLAIIVCIYHFFMPLLGNKVGSIFLRIFPINPNLIVFIVLLFIGIQMIIESIKGNEEIKLLSFIEKIMFGLAVSIDSFSVGISLQSISTKNVICAGIFSLSSLIFTYLGLILGKKISSIIGKLATIIGGITLIIIGFLYLLKK